MYTIPRGELRPTLEEVKARLAAIASSDEVRGQPEATPVPAALGGGRGGRAVVDWPAAGAIPGFPDTLHRARSPVVAAQTARTGED